jgi:hypothetical protein
MIVYEGEPLPPPCSFAGTFLAGIRRVETLQSVRKRGSREEGGGREG